MDERRRMDMEWRSQVSGDISGLLKSQEMLMASIERYTKNSEERMNRIESATTENKSVVVRLSEHQEHLFESLEKYVSQQEHRFLKVEKTVYGDGTLDPDGVGLVEVVRNVSDRLSARWTATVAATTFVATTLASTVIPYFITFLASVFHR